MTIIETLPMISDDISAEWISLRDTIYNTVVDGFGHTKHHLADWFDNDPEI